MKAYKVSADVYRGCGKAWAAIVDGRVVALRYMGNHRAWFGAEPEVLARAKRKRLCARSQLVAYRLTDIAFVEWRQRARAELKAIGSVVSGMCSCNEFLAETGSVGYR
jgi:hypothetical protein